MEHYDIDELRAKCQALRLQCARRVIELGREQRRTILALQYARTRQTVLCAVGTGWLLWRHHAPLTLDQTLVNVTAAVLFSMVLHLCATALDYAMCGPVLSALRETRICYEDFVKCLRLVEDAAQPLHTQRDVTQVNARIARLERDLCEVKACYSLYSDRWGGRWVRWLHGQLRRRRVGGERRRGLRGRAAATPPDAPPHALGA